MQTKPNDLNLSDRKKLHDFPKHKQIKRSKALLEFDKTDRYLSHESCNNFI